MCFTREGIYIVDGKKILIDHDNIDQLPLDVLNKLEAANMTQLDALYIRKNMHNLGKHLDGITARIDSIKIMQDTQYDTIVKKIDYVANKTIFGWIKNQYEDHALRTLLWMGIGFTFMSILILRIFDIQSFKDLVETIKHWFL